MRRAFATALRQLRLNRVPERLVDDRRVLPRMALPVVPDQPDVDRIAEDLMQRPTADLLLRSDRAGGGGDHSYRITTGGP